MSKEIVVSGKSQRYRCRDDREWEGSVWVAQNQVHFSQHFTNTTQHITQTAPPNKSANTVRATHKRRANQGCKSAAVRAVKRGECGTKRGACMGERERESARESAREYSRHSVNLVFFLSALFPLLPPSPLSPSFCLSPFLRFCAWVEAANSLRIALHLCLCVSERQ